MKPSLETFKKALKKYGGNVTKVAESFNMSRGQVHKWIRDDEEWKQALDDSRMNLFDDCLTTARVIALGIPNVEDGKIVGWTEKPDGNMLRYLLGHLGKNEGFGDSIDVTTNGKDVNSVNLFKVLTKEEIQNFDTQFENEY